MLYLGIIIALFILFLIAQILSLQGFIRTEKKEKEKLEKRQSDLEKNEIPLRQGVNDLEQKSADIFFFYDLTRKLAPILKKEELFAVFFEEMRYLGQIEKMSEPVADAEKSSAPDRDSAKDYLKLKLGAKEKEVLYIKTKSERIMKYLPNFSKLLGLCLERISLYEKLQQLSVYDSLTEVYNRRYMIERFQEEFKRAQRFNFNLSFLMIDIDHFKEINDTYGHLVGDVVLREVAQLTKSSIREIDFVARVGGEEFSVILTETDRVGAILVAERIRARVCEKKMQVFDEVLSATISVGVATFPQNTLYPELLTETADKALYKAKVSGRNRVGWF